MADWLSRLLGRQPKSANKAKERLQLVLIHDRTDLSPADMEALKDEMLAVISRYIEIDPQEVSIEMARDGREQRLVADIPIRGARKRRTA
jgi:cell division topological specificity factor